MPTALLDVQIVPYVPNYVRVWGDIKTRLWGGNPPDANFPEDFDTSPVPETITQTGTGTMAREWRRVSFAAPNAIPTIGAYTAYSISLATDYSTDIAVGTRVLVSMQITDFPENTDIAVGLAGTHSHDAWEGTDRLALQIKNEEGHLILSLLWGDIVVPTTLMHTPDYLVGKILLVELERTSATDARARFYFEEEGVDTPFIELSSPSTTTPVAGTVVLLSPKVLSQPYIPVPASVEGYIDFVTVEPGTGSTYTESPTSITQGEAQLRKARTGPTITLSDPDGDKEVCTILVDADGETDPSCSTITLDRQEPIAEILRVRPDSEILGIDNYIKVSLQPGFTDIALTFKSSKPGAYTLRANSTNPNDGIELVSGTYTSANTPLEVFFDLSNVGVSGVHAIDLWVVSASGIANAKVSLDYPLPNPEFLGTSLDVNIVV